MRFAFILQKSKTKIGKKKYTISKRPKSFPIGTIRSWGGIKYQKVSPIKWSAVTGQSGLNMAKMTSKDIKRLKKIKSYRGIRHNLGQPVRGQRTKSHFRTNRKKSGAVGVKPKK